MYWDLHIHVSAHVSVHIIAYIWFNMKSEACKIEFTRIYTCKIDFPYIQYFMAAKMDFTGKSILAAADPVFLWFNVEFRKVAEVDLQ